MELFNNWTLILLYILTSGIWGLLVKISVAHLNPFTLAFIGFPDCGDNKLYDNG